MAKIDTVLIKVAARCNLDCTYCYVYHMGDDGWRSQPKLLPLEVELAIAQQLSELSRAQRQGFSVVLHGGEPLLLGVRRLKQLFARMRSALPASCSLHIQTNGALLSSAMIDACAAYDVGISISLDGPAYVHDAFRIDHKGRGSHDRVRAAIERLRAHRDGTHLFSGILAVVDPSTDANVVYRYLKSTGAPSIDFLYRDGNHSTLPYGKQMVSSTEYGEWMKNILDAYVTDVAPPKIRILDDMLKLILGGSGVKEGVGLTDYGILVFETDGSINKNDTLKSAFRAADRFTQPRNVLHDSLLDIVQTEAFANYHEAQRPTSQICKACPELKTCGGGMVAHRWSSEREFDNPSVFCADQKVLISRMREWISRQRSAA